VIKILNHFLSLLFLYFKLTVYTQSHTEECPQPEHRTDSLYLDSTTMVPPLFHYSAMCIQRVIKTQYSKCIASRLSDANGETADSLSPLYSLYLCVHKCQQCQSAIMIDRYGRGTDG